MAKKKIKISRAPVLALWAAIVAGRLGYNKNEALTFGKAVAGLNAQSKGRRRSASGSSTWSCTCRPSSSPCSGPHGPNPEDHLDCRAWPPRMSGHAQTRGRHPIGTRETAPRSPDCGES